MEIPERGWKGSGVMVGTAMAEMEENKGHEREGIRMGSRVQRL